jgi:Fe-S-cluster containining protein
MTEPPRYLPILAELDRWQARAHEKHPGVIPCRTGCSACCHGPFDISVADVALLADAVASLPEPIRRQVRRGAAAQLARMTALEPDWAAPYDIATIGDARFDRISDTLADLPCPLLDELGACRIYPDRPMICRLMGLGLVSEVGDVIENGCPIQDRFPPYAALGPEPFPLDTWEMAEAEAKSAAAERLFGDAAFSEYETAIAAAITIWTA